MLNPNYEDVNKFFDESLTNRNFSILSRLLEHLNFTDMCLARPRKCDGRSVINTILAYVRKDENLHNLYSTKAERIFRKIAFSDDSLSTILATEDICPIYVDSKYHSILYKVDLRHINTGNQEAFTTSLEVCNLLINKGMDIEELYSKLSSMTMLDAYISVILKNLDIEAYKSCIKDSPLDFTAFYENYLLKNENEVILNTELKDNNLLAYTYFSLFEIDARLHHKTGDWITDRILPSIINSQTYLKLILAHLIDKDFICYYQMMNLSTEELIDILNMFISANITELTRTLTTTSLVGNVTGELMRELNMTVESKWRII